MLGIGIGIPGTGARGAYSLLGDPGLIEAWELHDATPGVAIATTAGRKNGWALRNPTGAQQPTFTAGALGAYPGAVFAGAHLLFCDAAGYQSALAARASVDVYAVVKRTAGFTGTTQVLVEQGVNSIAGPGFSIFIDDAGSDMLELIGFGTGLGYWRATSGTVPLTTAALVMGGLANPGAGGTGSTTRRLNEAELAGADGGFAAGSANYPSAALHVGARAGPIFASRLALGGLWLFAPGTAAERLKRSRYVARQFSGLFSVP